MENQFRFLNQNNVSAKNIENPLVENTDELNESSEAREKRICRNLMVHNREQRMNRLKKLQIMHPLAIDANTVFKHKEKIKRSTVIEKAVSCMLAKTSPYYRSLGIANRTEHRIVRSFDIPAFNRPNESGLNINRNSFENESTVLPRVLCTAYREATADNHFSTVESEIPPQQAGNFQKRTPQSVNNSSENGSSANSMEIGNTVQCCTLQVSPLQQSKKNNQSNCSNTFFNINDEDISLRRFLQRALSNNSRYINVKKRFNQNGNNDEKNYSDFDNNVSKGQPPSNLW